ncbi:DUF805 domain-containing protein [Agrobacterium vaccinii]|uniref:DUF805 domain-containing protein n=1 Tax=Agrobacterium vaccinii TaxID=2735528 RepID=UPI001E62A91F|nr:DUF805 domain-containing protein [Agrobacterium vaccinii]UHS60021.1 DUF805 domain-containing protein [Agrobacterium vaccinii]
MSAWHLIVIIALIAFPLIFVFRPPPPGPNRFGAPAMPMTFGEAFASFFRNYVNFRGRASRSEYWFSFLFVSASSLGVDTIDSRGFLSLIWSFILFLPMIAVSTRRLHDINRSGWHQLLSGFFPIGSIVVIVWYCTAGRDET